MTYKSTLFLSQSKLNGNRKYLAFKCIPIIVLTLIGLIKPPFYLPMFSSFYNLILTSFTLCFIGKDIYTLFSKNIISNFKESIPTHKLFFTSIFINVLLTCIIAIIFIPALSFLLSLLGISTELQGFNMISVNSIFSFFTSFLLILYLNQLFYNITSIAIFLGLDSNIKFIDILKTSLKIFFKNFSFYTLVSMYFLLLSTVSFFTLGFSGLYGIPETLAIQYTAFSKFYNK